LAVQVKRPETVIPEKKYRILGMSWYAKGLYIKYEKSGHEIKATSVYRVEKGDFVYNRLFAWKGSFAEVQDETHDCYVSNEYPCFKVTDNRIVPGYLWSYFAQPELWEYIERLSTGTTSTSRLRLKEARLKKFQIPLPPERIQQQLADLWLDSLRKEGIVTRISELLTQTAQSILERMVPLIGIDG
jgi:type I restriction enzyme S subunit